MTKHSRDGNKTNMYEEYGAPLKTLDISDVGDESSIYLNEDVSPTVIVRLIKQMANDIGWKEGVIHMHRGPTIVYETDEFLGWITITLHFHEQSIDKEFKFKSNIRGYPNDASAPSVTPPTELGGEIGPLARRLKEQFNIEYDFLELQGASFGGGGHVVDFEFKYDGVITQEDLESKIE